MRRRTLSFTIFLLSSFFLLSSLVFAQAPAPQSARQALIEMFFGNSSDHLERHLPDVTRKSFSKLTSSSGQSFLMEFSTIASQAKASGAKIETFDTGPTILTVEDQNDKNGDRAEITVERDDLVGDEDQIEVALHLPKSISRDGFPFVPHFTFAMKTEADIWRLSEISVTLNVPLTDPDFLKNVEDHQRAQNEQVTMWSMREVWNAEKAYSAAQGKFACSLGALAAGKGGQSYLFDPELASGKKYGYVVVISECDTTHYKVVAEPATADSGERAFCSDESGAIRAAADGKAVTCLNSGETVMEGMPATGADLSVGVSEGTPAPAAQPVLTAEPRPSKTIVDQPAPAGQVAVAQRVRVSQGVMQGLLQSRVAPVYPADAKAARVQGVVLLHAIIGKDGAVQRLTVENSASPLLTQSAIDAVKQWKYRPFLLNGNPVEVDTQITVNFTLAGR